MENARQIEGIGSFYDSRYEEHRSQPTSQNSFYCNKRRMGMIAAVLVLVIAFRYCGHAIGVIVVISLISSNMKMY